MKTLNVTSSSSNYTKQIANFLAKYIKKCDVVVLSGELGAGKTKFSEGFLEYFNLQDEISSPTFNIVNEYLSDDINIYHFDVYRLEDVDEFYAIGGEEYFEKGVSLIEWGELIEDALPSNYLKIKFDKDLSNPDIRILSFYANGTRYELLLDLLKEDLK